ncbi:transporter substrate-binding domain-containing protein [Nocardioides convexus]|uniref:transporter substrate-binding domain-containing protein n=1 Tax=Nocardioides convexus TaxID=2712224 RepID=UPI00241896C8|nr:transporter substrate-binding domain-containing protein [Nocardioides convexus]
MAVQEGTTGADYVKKNLPKGAKAVSFEDSALMMTAVKTGKVDAGVNDNGLVDYFVSQNPDTEVTKEFQTGESYGFGVKKGGNDALLKAINAGIADKGAYEAAHEKWFGSKSE